jgi:hypothetical protein
MKANELMIGNLVLNDRCVNTIENLMSNNTCTLKTKQGNYIHAQYDLIQPIPLTEELSLKLGFKEKSGWFGLYFSRLMWDETTNFTFELMDGILTLYANDVRIWIDRKPTIHVLQNFFYALTGKELTLK